MAEPGRHFHGNVMCYGEKCDPRYILEHNPPSNWHIAIPEVDSVLIDPIQSAAGLLAQKVAEHEDEYFRSLFGPGAPLEGLEKEFVIEMSPPEMYTSSDNFSPDCVNFGIKTKYRVRRKTEEEKSQEKQAL
jgi:hypothetical protein